MFTDETFVDVVKDIVKKAGEWNYMLLRSDTKHKSGDVNATKHGPESNVSALIINYF